MISHRLLASHLARRPGFSARVRDDLDFDVDEVLAKLAKKQRSKKKGITTKSTPARPRGKVRAHNPLDFTIDERPHRDATANLWREAQRLWAGHK